jgi:hypothetical protein
MTKQRKQQSKRDPAWLALVQRLADAHAEVSGAILESDPYGPSLAVLCEAQMRRTLQVEAKAAVAAPPAGGP